MKNHRILIKFVMLLAIYPVTIVLSAQQPITEMAIVNNGEGTLPARHIRLAGTGTNIGNILFDNITQID